MNTITKEQQAAIAARLQDMTLPVGLGTEESACSIAAINLALTGRLTDTIPACMSEVVGRWIIPIQDTMPDDFRNSQRWKALLPLAAGTGREREQGRLALIMDWMWGTVLPTMQPVADRNGFGPAWLAMTTRRTADAADGASDGAAGAAAANAAWWAAKRAAEAAGYAARAAWAAAYATDAAYAAAKAAWAAAYAGDADTDVWTTVAPCDLLERLIRVGEQR